MQGHTETLRQIKKNTDTLLEISLDENSILKRMVSSAEGRVPSNIVELVDESINVALETLIKSRFFLGFDRDAIAAKLGDEVQSGRFSAGSTFVRCKTLAWCGRIIASGNIILAKKFIDAAQILSRCIELKLAESFVWRLEGFYSKALTHVSNECTANVKSALFMLVVLEKGHEGVIEWTKAAQIRFCDVDAEGKFMWLATLLNLEMWDQALLLAYDVNEADYLQAPALSGTTAMCHLVQAVPLQIRSRIVQNPLPFELSTFPLADDNISMQQRLAAKTLFMRMATSAEQLGCEIAANVASDYHLWLTLRDESTKIDGLRLLKASLLDSRHSLRRVNFAVNFGLKLDISATEEEIERQEAISAGTSIEVATARFTLALIQENPYEVLKYLERHEKQLSGRIVQESLDNIEMQMLAQTGQIEKAETKISNLLQCGLDAEVEAKYRRFVSNAFDKNRDIQNRITNYHQSKKLENLVGLVDDLLKTKDWVTASQFAPILFSLTHALTDAESTVIAFENAKLHKFTREFLIENLQYIGRSNILQSAWCWTLYREGKLHAAQDGLEKLRTVRDEVQDRTLQIKIAITGGSWESLVAFAEKQWINRALRSPEELLYTASLVKILGSPRVKDLVIAATELAPDNPHILTNAYIIATELGWDDDGVASGWISSAAEKSTEDGPVRHIDIADVVKIQSGWNTQASETLKVMLSGGMPNFMAAKILKRTLLDLTLSSAIANTNQYDPRRRVLISAFTGTREAMPFLGKRISLDPTTLLTLGRLNLLPVLEDSFDNIEIPHSTLDWLFEERKKVEFHQPSQIKRAKFIRSLMSAGEISRIHSTDVAVSDLIFDVGPELAGILSEVQLKNTSSTVSHYAAISSEIYRADSLMREVVDLSEYSEIICYAKDILTKLFSEGNLTKTIYQGANAYLESQSQGSTRGKLLPDGAVVYFTEITLIHCYNAGILKYLRKTKLKLHISDETVRKIDELIEREKFAESELDVINSIKTFLAESISKQRITLTQQLDSEDAQDRDIFNHPSFSVIKNINKDIALVIDDRCFNKNEYIENNERTEKSRVVTTLDLLLGWRMSTKLSEQNYHDALTNLRRSCFVFIPIDENELNTYLDASTCVDGVLMENAELKAVREYLQRIRMSEAIQFPPEGVWLNNTIRAFSNAIKDQWLDNKEYPAAAARSNWLWAQIDAFKWSGIFPQETDIVQIEQQFIMQVILLVLDSPNLSSNEKDRYWCWLNKNVISTIKEKNPAIYGLILKWCKESVIDVVNSLEEREIGE